MKTFKEKRALVRRALRALKPQESPLEVPGHGDSVRLLEDAQRQLQRLQDSLRRWERLERIGAARRVQRELRVISSDSYELRAVAERLTRRLEHSRDQRLDGLPLVLSAAQKQQRLAKAIWALAEQFEELGVGGKTPGGRPRGDNTLWLRLPERIVLWDPQTEQDFDMGPFEIWLGVSREGDLKAEACALEPRPARARPDMSHPHVDASGKVCFGDSYELADQLGKDWRLVELVHLTAATLRSYNHENPYYDQTLAIWEGAWCASCRRVFGAADLEYAQCSCGSLACEDCQRTCDCGKSYCGGCAVEVGCGCAAHCFQECDFCRRTSCEECGEVRECEDCSRKVCEEHEFVCRECDKVLCKHHAQTCLQCSSYLCDRCRDSCSRCSETCCDGCLKDGLCEDCQWELEEEAEEAREEEECEDECAEETSTTGGFAL